MAAEPAEGACQVLSEPGQAHEFSRAMHRLGKTVVLVPTMGYLHAGHLKLVEVAKQHGDVIIMSIYLNPSQFSVTEDFGSYPRQQARDLQLASQAGVHAAFCPTNLYAYGDGPADAARSLAGAGQAQPGDHETWVQVEQLQKGLCGRSRPHFFRGVATVVTKLFNILDPDVAVFGEKDYQQLQVLRRMTRDLHFCIRIVGVPTQREPDGLAMSSRNAKLPPEARSSAVAIPQALQWAAGLAQQGEQPAAEVTAAVQQRIAAAGGEVDYVEAVDTEELTPLQQWGSSGGVLAVAARFGGVRLIDNIIVQPSQKAMPHGSGSIQ